MSDLIDFSNCKRIYGKAYNGANGKKIAIIYNGTRYMLKFPPSGEHKPTDLSYTNNGNWGFLYDLYDETSEIAPVYDCGSRLLPQADEKVMRGVLENEDMLHARIFQFPTSAIKLNGRKLDYYNFLTTTDNSDCHAALERIFPRIDFRKIDLVISDIPYITDLQKEFYRVYIKARYDLILKPAFARISS